MRFQNFSESLSQAVRFSVCGLIFFLPISIALSETFVGFTIFFWLWKKLRHFLNWSPEFGIRRIECLYPEPTELNKLLFVFLALCVVSIIFISPYKALGLRGFLGKELAWALVFWAVCESFSKQRQIRNLLTVLLFASFLNVTSGYVQYLTGVDFLRGREIMGDQYIGLRITSSWKHSNNFAGYLLLIIPLLLSFLAVSFNREKIFPVFSIAESYRARILSITGFVFFYYLGAFGFTYSRSAWIGFGCAVAFWIFYCRKYIFFGVAAAAVFFVVFLPKLMDVRQVSLISDQLNFLNLTEGQHMTAGGRFDLWFEAIELIKAHPFFGVGLNCYSKFATMYTHNSFLQLGAEMGLIGLGVYLLILTRLFIIGIRGHKICKNDFFSVVLIGTMSGLVGFLVQSFFDTHLYSSQLRDMFAVLMGVIVVSARLSTGVKHG